MTKNILLFIFIFQSITLFANDSISVFYYQGNYAIEKNKFDSANIYFQKAYEQDNSNIIYTKKLAKSYFLLNDLNKAISLYLKTNYKKQHYSDFELAQCYVKKENADSAFFFLKQHLESKYKHPKSEIKLDEFIKKLEINNQWKPLWNKSYYTKYEDILYDIKYYTKIKNHELAFETADAIIAKKEKAYKALFLRSQLYFEIKNYKNALNDINKAIEYKRNKVEYYEFRSLILQSLNKNKKAKHDILKAIELNPYNYKYYNKLGKTNYSLKEYTQAVNNWLFYYKVEFDNDSCTYQLAQAYFANNLYIKSLKYINKTIKLNPNIIDLYKLRGEIYYKSSLYDFAINDLTMFLDYKPQDGYVYYLRALCKLKKEETKSACKDFIKARNLLIMESDDYIKKHCLK